MPAGNDRPGLLRVIDELCAELRSTAGRSGAEHSSSKLGRRRGRSSPILDSEDESLVAKIMHGLAEVAVAADGGRGGDSNRAVGVALAGVELVIRGELVMGAPERLPALMPSFVFVVTLPVVEQERALELSRRTAQLLEKLG